MASPVSPTPFSPRARRRPSTSGERRLGIIALAVVILLASTLAARLPTHASLVLAEGDQLPLQGARYAGTTHEVAVPGATLAIRVGDPLEEVERGHVDLGEETDPTKTDPVRAAPGARLVPVTWTARPAHGGTSSEEETERVEVRLASGSRTADVVEGKVRALLSPDGEEIRPSTVVSLGGEGGLSDITVEVTYEGVTQVLSVASGEVDAGAAKGLYEEVTRLDTGCTQTEDRCRFSVTDPQAPWRPRSATFAASQVTLRTHTPELGWAGEGKQWATVSVSAADISEVENVAGGRRTVARAETPEMTLDGIAPQATSGPSGHRTAVFSVKTDPLPRRLSIRRELALEGEEAPQQVVLTTTTPLSEE